MTLWRRRVLLLVLGLLALGVPAYYWLFLESHIPGGGYDLDLAQVRKLADKLPGEKPTEIRVEELSDFEFPKGATVAGGGWSKLRIPVFSYQLIFPSSRAVIDTGMDEALGAQSRIAHFQTAAFERLGRAMEQAELIVLTHEHPDHLGGLAAHPKVAQLLSKARLTKEQLTAPERLAPLVLPKAFEGYQPLTYEKYLPVAPGVVLIKSAGHSPGSQMVFVRRADGAEYLFLGDVAWQWDNVKQVKGRPRLVSQFLLKEDRKAVMRQLVELNRLLRFEPALTLIPGHDAARVDELVKSKALTVGFDVR